jgi:hypothetical protein
MLAAAAESSPGWLACADPDNATIELVAMQRVAAKAQRSSNFIELLRQFNVAQGFATSGP